VVSATVPFAPHFHDEMAAYAFVEALLWPNGRICPHCGSIDRSGRLDGKSTRPGLYKCYECRKPFTVKIGTPFESSNVKLHIWLRALYFLCATRNRGNTAHLKERLGVTAKTAWSIRQRIRDAMRQRTLPPALAEAFADGRQTLPRHGGIQPPRLQSQRSWSSAWNMAAEQDRHTVAPTLSRRRTAWWMGRTTGGLE
jgi:transposase-like protein